MLSRALGRTATRSLLFQSRHKETVASVNEREGEVDVLSPEEYNAKKAEYEKELHRFRLQVKEELEIVKQKEEPHKAEAETASGKKARSRDERDPENVKRLRQERAQKQAEQAHEAKKRREASFFRETLRRDMIKKKEDERYTVLLEQSRTWITKDTLDERIAMALDSAATLY